MSGTSSRGKPANKRGAADDGEGRPEPLWSKHIASIVAIVVAVTSSATTLGVTGWQQSTAKESQYVQARLAEDSKVRSDLRAERQRVYGQLESFYMDWMSAMAVYLGNFGSLRSQHPTDINIVNNYISKRAALQGIIEEISIIGGPDMRVYISQLSDSVSLAGGAFDRAVGAGNGDPSVNVAQIYYSTANDLGKQLANSQSSKGVELYTKDKFLTIARADIGNVEVPR
ncbi:hypothetical protein [Nocardia nova]|uniref:hypothetical protein n=1 Tax=Nocardia nova TaxID=37330 RepID=UPI0033DFDA49